jgi:hypothetical protein
MEKLRIFSRSIIDYTDSFFIDIGGKGKGICSGLPSQSGIEFFNWGLAGFARSTPDMEGQNTDLKVGGFALDLFSGVKNCPEGNF